MRNLLAVVVVASIALCGRARADDVNHLAPYYRWRWEAALGGAFGSLRLRQQELYPGGLLVMAGIRNHRFGISGDFRRLGVTWNGGTGTLDRLGWTVRYNFVSLGPGDAHDEDGARGHEFFELFAEAGAGVEWISWDQGGELLRGDGEVGLGGRIMGMRINDRHTLGIMFRIVEFVSRRPPDYNMAPTCSGPCTVESRPDPWDSGLMVGIALVMSG